MRSLMKYIYGPVKSRRLGFSLGVSLTPYKICNFDCVYCQLGRTAEKTSQRKEYANINEVFNELKLWFETNAPEAEKLNYITLSGSGEPTLNEKFGELIIQIKKLISVPVAVITNASLLNTQAVRQALLNADLIVPSLDAVTPQIFAKIDRPLPALKIEEIINGLIGLKREFRGKIWLEVMLARGINDDLRHIRKIKETIDKINPDKIQLNSPVRTTAEPGIFSVDKGKLKKIKDIFGDRAEII